MESPRSNIGGKSRPPASAGNFCKSPMGSLVALLVSRTSANPILFAVVVSAVALASTPGFAIDLLTWNTDLGTVESIAGREAEIEKLGDEVKTKTKTGKLPEVTVLEEVTSYAAAASVARALGYENATVVVSNSGDDSSEAPIAEEVAIITTEQLAEPPTSYQQFQLNTPPFVLNLATGKFPDLGVVKKLDVPEQIGAAARSKDVPRAILRVGLQNGVVIYGVHLKANALSICRTGMGKDFCTTGEKGRPQQGSLNLRNAAELLEKTAEKLGLSGEAKQVETSSKTILDLLCSTDQTPTPQNPGTDAVKKETLESARKREAVAGAVAKLAATDFAEKHVMTVFVAGDFNTPVFEQCKTGTNINEDFEPLEGCNTAQTPKTCGTQDGFDDTYSILTSGLVGVSFKVLTGSLGRTYANEDYVDSPIDNVLISGQGSSDKFEALKLGNAENGKIYGSDHYPVLVQSQ